MDSAGMKCKREEDGEEEQEQEEQAAAPMAASPARNPEPAVAAPPSATGEPRPRPRAEAVADALNFVRRVKRALGWAKYFEFAGAIRQIRSTGLRGMVDRMKVLLRGHPDLKRHFNTFMPTQYKLSLTDDDVNQQEEAPADSLQAEGRPAQRD